MKQLKELFGVSEAYRLPDKIMEALLSGDAEEIIKDVKNNTDCNIRDMFQQEHGDRRELKQDFTPDCVCTLVANLMVSGNFLDMCSGTGALSKAAAKRLCAKICEQEFSERTIPFALLDACINGMEGYISRADCLRNKVLETYRVERRGNISVPRVTEKLKDDRKYDNVIMNPPYSMKFPDAGDYPMNGIVIPKSKADYGFLFRGIENLKEKGRLIAILPHGVLFRGMAERKAREYLIHNRMINAIIGLPDKLFMNTSIPVCLVIAERNSPNVLFINAEKKCIKKSSQNDMTEDQINTVTDLFYRRKEQDHISHVATYEEIKKNDYNLNIPRYVNTYEQEPLPDAHSILEELEMIDREEQQLKSELYRIMGELTGSETDMRIVEKHRKIMKPKKINPEQAEQMELMDIYADAMQTSEY